MGLLSWLESGFLGTWVRESLWSYAILLTLHSIGMALLVGTLFVINLRVMGFGNVALAPMERFVTIIWAGFVLSALSGLSLFAGQATTIFSSRIFMIKMGLIVLGGLTNRMVIGSVFSSRVTTSGVVEYPASVKYVAGFSLLFWFGAIVAGRLTAYLP
jgi:hypothetical protein